MINYLSLIFSILFFLKKTNKKNIKTKITIINITLLDKNTELIKKFLESLYKKKDAKIITKIVLRINPLKDVDVPLNAIINKQIQIF